MKSPPRRTATDVSGVGAGRKTASAALRRARRAWACVHVDSSRSLVLAEEALALARAAADSRAEGWARLARGFHRLYFATPAQAGTELRAARCNFDQVSDRPGQLLADTLIARVMWRNGRVDAALRQVLAVRDEGLALLKDDQRGVLLNTIAGCYSAQGRSDQAFAYMYQALRGAGPTRGNGFDTVLHCNLSHEMLQIGDYEEGLRHVEAGLARYANMKNPRLHSVLTINRVICLTELGRAGEAAADIAALIAVPATGDGRGPMGSHFETLAIAALLAGDHNTGARLIGLAHAAAKSPAPEEAVELAVADALWSMAKGRLERARKQLLAVKTLAGTDKTAGLSLRVRCRYFQTLAELHQRRSLPGVARARADAQALEGLRRWQALHLAQGRLASQARYQAAALQTELLRLQHQLDATDEKRRSTERARAELAAANEQLEHKIAEVQALQAALREQATRDPLTGLFNRRHLNDALPAMLALARRDAQPLAVAVLDLDHFKAVNDQLGHDAGDQVLVAFAQLLASSSRKSDLVCRWGGEEFCLVMPRTDAAAGRRRVTALLRRWRSDAAQLLPQLPAPLSFSAGVTDSAGVSLSPQALLNAADGLLLQAKSAGRNRVLGAGIAGAATAVGSGATSLAE